MRQMLDIDEKTPVKDANGIEAPKTLKFPCEVAETTVMTLEITYKTSIRTKKLTGAVLRRAR